jgi:hypothetical protein
MNKPVITTEGLKSACKKGEFRKLFPELRAQFDAYIQKPGCGHCAAKLISGLMNYPDKLRTFFGEVEFDVVVPESFDPVVATNFSVINCSVHELEDRLNALPAATYQITVARYEDQVTVVINRLD